MKPHRPVLTERTSKALKAQLIFSSLVWIPGLLLTFYSLSGDGFPPARIIGLSLAAVGLVWHIIVRCLIWWEHE